MIMVRFFSRSRHGFGVATPALVAATMLVFAMASTASAQQAFRTAEEGVDALVSAVRSGERRAILSVLGRNGADIVSSGDAIADAMTRELFLATYDARHHVEVTNDKGLMVIGQEDFPFPIPLVRKNGAWRFDTAAGRMEILYRRIGRNELSAIQVCLAYLDAQNEYADQDRTGAGVGIYAQRIVSRPGKKDGLYWPTGAQGGDESPLGELVAQASTVGYRIGGGARRAPFRGYYYKILTRQGTNAPGGALDYVVGGKMIGGFALVAYPAEYGNSGVMTFLVNHAGTVFQKDLGPRTPVIAPLMTSFDLDQTWKVVDNIEAR
jgi:hypothetical protein